jgi:TonB-dependent receptor
MAANYKNNHRPLFNKSLVAMALMGVCATASAQQNSTEQANSSEAPEVIEVKGQRGSVIKAQELKREADTFLDAITATDIGALPDRSVLEALQRVPGISIERFAAANDPDHFGIEGSGAVIRGLSATRSEFNGRDSFTANSGRGLSFQDVPPELTGSVRVYKNQSADLIEGGIGGTVSLHTRLPFDSDKRVVAVSLDATYSDLIEKTTPTASAMFSDSWQTDIGKVGFLINIAKSELESLSHNLQSEVFLTRNDLGTDQTVLVPNGGNFGKNNINRERDGLALAAQWESQDKRTLLTGQFLRSDATLGWKENVVSLQTDINDGAQPDGLRRDSFPQDGTSYEYDDQGTFVNGIITDQRSGGWRSNGSDQSRIPVAADWGNPSVPQFGNIFQTNTRVKEQNTVVEDYALNYKFRPNDSWSHEVDFQFIDAETKDDDVTLFFGTAARQSLDFRDGTPRIGLLNPWGDAVSGQGFENDDNYFQNPSSYYWRSAQDHIERSEGDSKALRYDTKYVFDSGFFSSIKVGARYAKRQQTVRFSDFNWQPTGALFGGDHNDDGYDAVWLDLPVAASLADETQQVVWNDHHRGSNVSIPGLGHTLHPSLSLVQDYQNWGTRLDAISKTWVPLAERQIQNGVDADGNPTFEQLQGPFRPAEINEFVETNKAFYVRLDFESDAYKFPFTGNIGFRYVDVKRRTQGAVTFPDLLPQANVDPADDANLFLSADERAFGDFGTAPLETTYRDDFILPSFNIKVELGENLISRFAVSKAIAYPDSGLTKNFVSIDEEQFTQRSEPTAPGEETEIVSSEILAWTAQAGNPLLAPMESVQYDLSLEWYFSDSDSLTTTVFYKDLSNFITSGARNIDFENNGVTQTVEVQQAINSGDGSMQGFEIAYSQFFNSLPAPFDGLGMQANYTYIDAKGIPNVGLSRTTTDGAPSDGPRGAAFDSLPLEGQSRHTANFVLTYEKNALSARLAYNWRSDYLLTARDVIAPFRPIYNESNGFLDGSIFYNVNENVKVGLQGVNLLDTETRTTMQIDDQGTRTGRSWFINDRRFSFIVRANF